MDNFNFFTFIFISVKNDKCLSLMIIYIVHNTHSTIDKFITNTYTTIILF